jgi:TolB-like protein
VLAGGCSAARPAAQPISSPAGAAAGAQSSGRRQTVAVFPFENNAVTDRDRLDFMRDWLADTIAARLQETGELRVVERQSLLEVLREEKLGSSELASPETRLRLGRIAGAQTMIFGGFSVIGETLELDARVADVESGAILKSVSSVGEAARMRQLSADLCDKLVADLGLTVTRRATELGVLNTSALRGAEFYYAGVAQERSGKRDEAIESYRHALEVDHNDQQARERLQHLLGPL